MKIGVISRVAEGLSSNGVTRDDCREFLLDVLRAVQALGRGKWTIAVRGNSSMQVYLGSFLVCDMGERGADVIVDDLVLHPARAIERQFDPGTLIRSARSLADLGHQYRAVVIPMNVLGVAWPTVRPASEAAVLAVAMASRIWSPGEGPPSLFKRDVVEAPPSPQSHGFGTASPDNEMAVQGDSSSAMESLRTNSGPLSSPCDDTPQDTGTATDLTDTTGAAISSVEESTAQTESPANEIPADADTRVMLVAFQQRLEMIQRLDPFDVARIIPETIRNTSLRDVNMPVSSRHLVEANEIESVSDLCHETHQQASRAWKGFNARAVSELAEALEQFVVTTLSQVDDDPNVENVEHQPDKSTEPLDTVSVPRDTGEAEFPEGNLPHTHEAGTISNLSAVPFTTEANATSSDVGKPATVSPMTSLTDEMTAFRVEFAALATSVPRESHGWPLDSVPLTVRCKNVLRREGISTVGDLVGIDPGLVFRWRGVGLTSMSDLLRSLRWLTSRPSHERPIEGDGESPASDVGSEIMVEPSWLIEFSREQPELSEHISSLKIASDEDFVLRRGNLVDDARDKADWFRFTRLLRKVNRNDPFALARIAPLWALDVAFSNLDLTTRCRNVLRSQGIERIADLVQYHVSDAFQWPNFGRHSVSDLAASVRDAIFRLKSERDSTALRDLLKTVSTDLWADIQQAVERAAATHERKQQQSLWDALQSSLNDVESETHRQALRLRLGFDGTIRTLAEVGELLSLSRERVRQIEAKHVRKWAAVAWWGPQVEARIRAILDGRATPLALSTLAEEDPWFRGFDNALDGLEHLITQLSEGRLNGITIAGKRVIARCTQQDIVVARRKILSVLGTLAATQRRVSELKTAISEVMAEVSSPELADALFGEFRDRWVCGQDDQRNEDVVVGTGSPLALAIHAVLKELPAPTHMDEIAKRLTLRLGRPITNRIAARLPDFGALLFGRGVYGTSQHIPVSDEVLDEIRTTVEVVVANGPVGRQWHADELMRELERIRPDMPGDVDRYILRIALMKAPSLRYLGRMCWMRQENMEVSPETRLDTRDACIQALRNAGRPLTTTELREIVSESRDLGRYFLVSPGPGLMRLGANLWGLPGRDMGLDVFEQSAILNQLESVLNESLRALTTSQIAEQVLETAGSRARQLNGYQLLGLAQTDSRFKVFRGQLVGLREWDSPRTMTLRDAITQVLESSTDAISLDVMAKSVEDLTGSDVDRGEIAQFLRLQGLQYSLDQGTWRRTSTADEFDDLEFFVDAQRGEITPSHVEESSETPAPVNTESVLVQHHHGEGPALERVPPTIDAANAQHATTTADSVAGHATKAVPESESPPPMDGDMRTVRGRLVQDLIGMTCNEEQTGEYVVLEDDILVLRLRGRVVCEISSHDVNIFADRTSLPYALLAGHLITQGRTVNGNDVASTGLAIDAAFVKLPMETLDKAWPVVTRGYRTALSRIASLPWENSTTVLAQGVRMDPVPIPTIGPAPIPDSDETQTAGNVKPPNLMPDQFPATLHLPNVDTSDRNAPETSAVETVDNAFAEDLTDDDTRTDPELLARLEKELQRMVGPVSVEDLRRSLPVKLRTTRGEIRAALRLVPSAISLSEDRFIHASRLNLTNDEISTLCETAFLVLNESKQHVHVVDLHCNLAERLGYDPLGHIGDADTVLWAVLSKDVRFDCRPNLTVANRGAKQEASSADRLKDLFDGLF